MFTSYSRFHQQFQQQKQQQQQSLLQQGSVHMQSQLTSLHAASHGDESSTRTVSLYGGGGRRSAENATSSHNASMYCNNRPQRTSTISSDPRSPKNAAMAASHTNESPTMSTSASAASVNSSNTSTSHSISFSVEKVIGQGTFGTVYLARINETGESVAIKKVLQDKTCKHRELQIMKQLHRFPHPFIMQLKYHYITQTSASSCGTGGRAGDRSCTQTTDTVGSGEYLNLVLEYMPETMHSLIRSYSKRQDILPAILIKTYMFQLLRALAHIHGLGIVHRDLKPQNILIDPARAVLKLADFGSAKPLVHGEPNVAYIGSRYYRAPELILGSTEYSTAIDVWSAGCVFAEMMLGRPVFPGMSASDQLIEIVTVLGSPTEEQLCAMDHTRNEVAGEAESSALEEGEIGERIDHRMTLRVKGREKDRKGKDREKVMKVRVPAHISSQCLYKVFAIANPQPQAIALISSLLDYNPMKRVKAIDACCAHPYFNELRLPGVCVPSSIPGAPGMGLPRNLLHFTKEELSLASSGSLRLVAPSLLSSVSVDEQSTINSALSPSVSSSHDDHDEVIMREKGTRGRGGRVKIACDISTDHTAIDQSCDDVSDLTDNISVTHSHNQSKTLSTSTCHWQTKTRVRNDDTNSSTKPASSTPTVRFGFIDRLLSGKQ